MMYAKEQTKGEMNRQKPKEGINVLVEEGNGEEWEQWHGPGRRGWGGGWYLWGWSVLPPFHPPEESPLALKSKTCINNLYRAHRPYTHWAKHMTFMRN